MVALFLQSPAAADCIDYGDYLQWTGGVYTLGGRAIGVAVSGTYAYVADGYSGLLVIDITNPASPQIVGNADTPGNSTGVAVSGTYAYVSDYDYGLQVIDITNPASPQIVGSVDTPGGTLGVAVSGTHAYVADWDYGLQVIDITNPASPQIVGSVDTPGGADDVAVSGTHAYVADHDSGLQVIDITNPANPQIMGGVDTPGLAEGVAVSGTYAYIADSDYGLQVLSTQCGSATGVGEDDWVASTMLVMAYPNPASPQTLIRFETRNGGPVLAAVHDLSGRLVRRLAERFRDAGVHDVTWDGRDEDGRAVAAGIYLVRVSASEGSTTARVMMIR
jgi:hypothetical protein